MNSSALTVVTAPGLPSWPGLFFDARRKRAVVSFRLATWRSWTLAHRVSVLLGWTVNLLVGWWLWHKLNWIGDPIGRGSLTFFGFGLAGTFTKPLFPAAFDGFLARQLFSSRSTVWFTPERIAFRSRLYVEDVVLGRMWQGRPIQTRFDVTSDPEAMDQRAATHGGQGIASARLQTASLLRLIITAFDPQRTVAHGQQIPLVRAVPMLAVDLSDAQRLTVVLAAAVALTACTRSQNEHATADGVDIDSAAEPSLSQEAPHGID